MSRELLGRYELVSLIGEGAMGTVYRAYDPHLERAVAIKVMSAALGNGPEAVARFKREAIALAALKHPQIVTIHDFLALSGNLCLVMELIEGEPLDRVIDQRQPLTVLQKLAFMASVCRALDYAHNHGIIHRDLKPSNILMLPDGTPKIVDFGIAKMANDDLTRKLTRTNARIGTISYMSPEQFNGEPVDHRTDIFSAGIVLYELLSGISPFQGAHTSATMKKIILDPTPSLPPHTADVPDSVHGILMRALAKDASQRYSNAAQFAYALERCNLTATRSFIPDITLHEITADESNSQNKLESRRSGPDPETAGLATDQSYTVRRDEGRREQTKESWNPATWTIPRRVMGAASLAVTISSALVLGILTFQSVIHHFFTNRLFLLSGLPLHCSSLLFFLCCDLVIARRIKINLLRWTAGLYLACEVLSQGSTLYLLRRFLGEHSVRYAIVDFVTLLFVIPIILALRNKGLRVAVIAVSLAATSWQTYDLSSHHIWEGYTLAILNLTWIVFLGFSLKYGLPDTFALSASEDASHE